MLTAKAAANTLINVGPFSCIAAEPARAVQTRPCECASNGLMAILLHPYLPSKIYRLRLQARETPNRMHSLLRLRPRGRVLRGLCGPVLLAAALAAAGCGSTTRSPTPSDAADVRSPRPSRARSRSTAPSRSPSSVQTAGAVVATFTALDPSDADLVGLSIGTWNGIACSVGAPTLANDNAIVGRRAHRVRDGHRQLLRARLRRRRADAGHGVPAHRHALLTLAGFRLWAGLAGSRLRRLKPSRPKAKVQSRATAVR